MIKEQKLDLHLIVKQSDNAIVSNMNDEKVMLSIKNGNYYNLGAIGGQIWELIADHRTIAELIATLLSIYDVDKDTCEGEVILFLKQMAGEELIHIYDKKS